MCCWLFICYINLNLLFVGSREEDYHRQGGNWRLKCQKKETVSENQVFPLVGSGSGRHLLCPCACHKGQI